MARYDPLIRLRKWELDEKRRVLRGLEDEVAFLEAQITAVKDEIQRASQMQGDDVSVLTMGSFLEGARLKISLLGEMKSKKQQEVDDQQELVSAAFQDLKTIEIASEKLEDEEAKALAKFEQLELDEAGLQAYARRNKS